MGAKFGMDPVAVLAEPDPLLWDLRIAAYNVLAADAKAASK